MKLKPQMQSDGMNKGWQDLLLLKSTLKIEKWKERRGESVYGEQGVGKVFIANNGAKKNTCIGTFNQI